MKRDDSLAGPEKVVARKLSPGSNPNELANGAGFTVEEAADHFWIRDGARRVLLFVRMPAGGFFCNAVFLRQPGSPPPEFPESYHSATAIGLQADIRWRWGADWQPMERAALELGTSAARIAFTRRSASGRNEQKITLTLRRTGGDPTDYVVHCHSVLIGDTPAGKGIEFLNFLPADAGNSWPGLKRFRSTVHEWDPGHFERRPHSPLTVIEPYYWPDENGFRRPQVAEPPFKAVFDPALRQLGGDAPFAVAHLYKPLGQGGRLFFAGEEVTPAVRVIHSNAPVVLETCDVWYDEHLCLERGTLEPDGRFRYEVEYELFGLTPDESCRLTAAATTVEFSRWAKAHEFAAFFCNRVNHFAIPATREYDGSTGLFFAYGDPAHLVSWQRQTDLPGRGAIVLNTIQPIEPPSGQYYQSVRYELGGVAPWIEAFPLGFSLHVARGETVEFSALIKLEGEAEAWLEMREAFWGKIQREHQGDSALQVARAGPVISREWTRVTGRMTAHIPGSLSMIFLAMRGRGRASYAELEVRQSKE